MLTCEPAEDGFYEEEKVKTQGGPTAKQRVLKKIPTEVIKNAKGLAIFTTMRTGLWISGAGGSGVLVARTDDGSWSPPVGILLHTAGVGFLIGVDIYDCVLVLNTDRAVQAFSKWRCTLGGEISAVAGPVGMGGIVDTEVHKRQSPVFTYLKSRGFYAAVQMDGTVIIERSDENERFYGQRLPAKDILAGKAQSREWELRVLMETLKSAQGDTKIDQALLPAEPPPADYEVVEDGHIFGIPDSEDPDPYGVLALEKEGLGIKEAGSKQPASSDDFEFKPSVSSPVFTVFRKTFDSPGSGSRRGSVRGSTSTMQTFPDRPKYASQDMSTQTEFDMSALASPTRASVKSIKEEDLLPSPPSSAGVEVRPDTLEDLTNTTRLPPAHDGTDEADVSDEEEDAQVIQHVQQHVQQAPKFVQKPRMVAVAKRAPPPLPPRNPGRVPSATNTPDTQSLAGDIEEQKTPTHTNGAEKQDDVIDLDEAADTHVTAVEMNHGGTQTHDVTAATAVPVKSPEEPQTNGNGDHEDTDLEDFSDDDEFDDADADIQPQVVTAVSAKVTQIRKLEPSPVVESSNPMASAEHQAEPVKNGVNGTLHEKAVAEAEHAAVSTAVASTKEKEPEEVAEELPGAFPEEPSTSLAAPSLPPRSDARGKSKSPVRNANRVSIAGIRNRLMDDDEDEDEEAQPTSHAPGHHAKAEDDDFS